MNLPTEPLLRTVGRRLYTKPGTASSWMLLGKWVYLLENGLLLDAVTLEKFNPTDDWFHAETHNENAVYVLMLRWSDKWGEECVAHFGSAESAADFVRDCGLGNHIQQRVRLIL